MENLKGVIINELQIQKLSFLREQKLGWKYDHDFVQ